jgi:hypothetical protein
MKILKNAKIKYRTKLHVSHGTTGGFRNIASKAWTKPVQNHLSQVQRRAEER